VGRFNRRNSRKYQEFLEQAQSETGGFYEETTNERPVEFLRPLKCPFVRVQDMRNKEKRNVHFENLTPLNEMKVLAYMTWTEEDERRSLGPESISTPDSDPQEPGDVGFLR
jgi:hypothetical protein